MHAVGARLAGLDDVRGGVGDHAQGIVDADELWRRLATLGRKQRAVLVLRYYEHALGFTVPAEAAVHLHVDGDPFRHPRVLANLIRLFGHWREPLHQVFRTNPACRRLAALPIPLVAVTDIGSDTAALRQAADDSRLSKFFDVNLTQVLTDRPLRDTVEIRILPGSIDADEIVHQAALAELLLDRCLDDTPFPDPPTDPAGAVDSLLAIAAAVLASPVGH